MLKPGSFYEICREIRDGLVPNCFVEGTALPITLSMRRFGLSMPWASMKRFG